MAGAGFDLTHRDSCKATRLFVLSWSLDRVRNPPPEPKFEFDVTGRFARAPSEEVPCC